MNFKERINEFIDKNIESYKEIAKDIHRNPEVSNYEFHACEVLSNKLKEEGFEVKVDVAGHRTGFVASYKSKKEGPVAVFLAEYDALVGIGHACGHNLFGVNSSLAAVALKNVIDEIGGEVRVYGTPGEEGGENGSAKGSFVREGFLDDVDFALCAHPGSSNKLSTRSLAVHPVVIKFYGKPAHAAASPEEGINALDALIQTYNAINALRQHVTSDVRIHGIITKGGDAPNIVPEYAEAKFFIRANTKKQVYSLREKFDNIVKGAALQTGATGTIELYQNAVDDMVLTPLLDEIYAKNVEGLNHEVDYTDKKGIGSSDVGNVSYIVPTIQPTFKISINPIIGHTEDFKNASCSEYGLDAIRFSSKALAHTAIDLILDKELLNNVKKQHKEALEKVNNI